MNWLEIIMLIAGIMIIVISFGITARPDAGKNSESLEGANKDGNTEGLDLLRKQQSEILSSVSEDTIARTDDYLSKLSNETIMAVSEYSDQILEKIARSHEDVVFLYNMLNHKEKELKETVRIIDESQRKTKEILRKNENESLPGKDISLSEKSDIQEYNRQAQNMQLTMAADMEEQDMTEKELNHSVSVNNEDILKMYGEGQSIIEIARQLGIGQGEVKLVVDLFKN